MDVILTCHNLSKSYGSLRAVDGVSFQISRGECYGLLGPNGAGKTTTIAMICGLVGRDSGDVTVAGQKLDTHSVGARGAIGLVPQELALYPELSAADNLRFFGRLYGLTGTELGRRVEATLETVGLADRASERVERYSGGMKRRVNIAAGLIHQPQLLVLDEPTVGVDPQSRNSILTTIETLRDSGMAVLYTTHYMEEAERLCDRVGIIDGGHLIAEGTRRELVDSTGALDRVKVTAAGDLAGFGRDCAGLAGVHAVQDLDGRVELEAAAGRRLLRPIMDLADRHDLDVASVEVAEPDLESVFLNLTGRELRD
ncbi:MAG: ABC transporter ATP-binding protein [Acidimicrobiales bacterium]